MKQKRGHLDFCQVTVRFDVAQYAKFFENLCNCILVIINCSSETPIFTYFYWIVGWYEACVKKRKNSKPNCQISLFFKHIY